MLLTQFNGALPGMPAPDQNIRNLVLAALLQACPILNYAQFYRMTGSADTARTKATATGGNVRALNESFTDQTTEPEFTEVYLRIFGDTIKTDDEFQARGLDLASEHARELESFARAMGRDLFNRLINDTFSATTFAGIKALSSSTTTTFDASGDGTVPLGNATAEVKQKQKFIEAIDNLLGSVDGGADVVIMDSKTKTRLKAVARDYFGVTTLQDVYGVNQSIESLLDVPIITSGYAKNGTGLVIPHDEVVDMATDRTGCTSIYALKFGEKEDFTLATNVGLRVDGPTKVDNFLKTLVQLSIGTMLVNDKALQRLEGIKIV